MTTVTYCLEDDKIRLYVGRVPREEYDILRKAGFISTPKQDCDFVATWTPQREDLARQYLEDDEDIEDEDYSPEERSADRAERFGVYRDKRASEAGNSADTFDSGPSAHGHQNHARAERAARRHDRHRTYAVSQWSKAEYWQERTRAVIKHALHKSSAKVRRGRILALESEQRKFQSGIDKHRSMYSKWEKVTQLEGSDKFVVYAEGTCELDQANRTPATRLAVALAGGYFGHCWTTITHPRTGVTGSAYDHIRSDDPLTAAEMASLWLSANESPDEPTSYDARWVQHYEFRLAYERAMLAEEGGSAADTEMEVGGWIGRHQIHRIWRSPVTKKVVSVGIWGPHPWRTTGDGQPEMGVQKINIQKYGESVYRAPTDEERAKFSSDQKEKKANAKASKGNTVQLINPTDEDAQRLQDYWNEVARQRYDSRKSSYSREYVVQTVKRMTQAEYSEVSKCSHSRCETVEVCTHGRQPKSQYGQNIDPTPVAFKIRKCSPSGDFWNGADRVVVIADKPQKQLPLKWDSISLEPVAN